MKKDIRWLKEKIIKQDSIMRTGTIHIYYLMYLIDSLDEPEVLSKEWIDEHAVAVAYDGVPDQTEIVYVDDLEKLLN